MASKSQHPVYLHIHGVVQMVPQGTEGVISSASGSAIARVVLPAQYDPGENVLLVNENVSKSGPV